MIKGGKGERERERGGNYSEKITHGLSIILIKFKFPDPMVLKLSSIPQFGHERMSLGVVPSLVQLFSELLSCIMVVFHSSELLRKS